MQLQQVAGIITGGAQGLGRDFAEAILSGGGRVFLTDINADGLERTGRKLRSLFGRTNVGWTVHDVVERHGFIKTFEYASKFFGRPVNLLVNNAGIAESGATFPTKDDLPKHASDSFIWEKTIDINLTATIRGTQAAVHHMKQLQSRGEEGVIINISSSAGLHPVTFCPIYAASKAGVVGFTRSCVDFKKLCNIRVVALCPVFADTDMGRLAKEVMPEAIELQGGLIPTKNVTLGLLKVLEDDKNAGRALIIHGMGEQYWRFPGDRSRQLAAEKQAKL